MAYVAFFGNALSIVLLALGASSSGAQDLPVVISDQPVVAAPTQDCECRARGKTFSLGEQVCLNGTVAICEMNQNVTTWRPTRDQCPNARVFTPVRLASAKL